MPSAAYFRRQADICLRLAVIASDEEVSNRLIMMAREYTAKGAALTRQSGVDALPGADHRHLPRPSATLRCRMGRIPPPIIRFWVELAQPLFAMAAHRLAWRSALASPAFCLSSSEL